MRILIALLLVVVLAVTGWFYWKGETRPVEPVAEHVQKVLVSPDGKYLVLIGVDSQPAPDQKQVKFRGIIEIRNFARGS